MGPRRDRWWIAAATAFAAAVRIWGGTRFLPRPLAGDEVWYAKTAADLLGAETSPPWADPYYRAPGMTWFLSGVFGLFGVENVAAAIVSLALVSALTCVLVAVVARVALPGVEWAPVALAWLQALSPWQFRSAQLVLSENLYVPLTVLFAWLVLRLVERPTWRRTVALGLTGAAVLHIRADCLPLVVGGVAFGALVAWRRGTPPRAALLAWAGAGALALTLCVPWSLHVSAQRGRAAFLADATGSAWMRHRRGFGTWLGTTAVTEQHFRSIFWLGPHHCPPELIPASVFDSEAERVRVYALLERARIAKRWDATADAGFLALGEERIAAAPVRYYVGLPLLRAARMWLTFAERRDVPPEALVDPSLRLRVQRWWHLAYELLGAIGFLLALPLCTRLRRVESPLALLIPLRTLSLVAGLPLLIHWPVLGYRYVSNVVPLTYVLAVGALAYVARTAPHR